MIKWYDVLNNWDDNHKIIMNDGWLQALHYASTKDDN
jgi:hypothetical protein